uniref:Toxin candidate TRINITY_DN7249_c0_g1_i1.p1 n=1 Tax=Pachycerianthus borealis TaxID=2736680 RepID=A0A7G7WYV7_9CNID|nr:toxin candidate TRINITY_DN7249_c0_g1_i1.p1 [Pachycerianthus borealis]
MKNILIFLVSLIVILTLVKQNEGACDVHNCPYGWVPYKCYCYQFSTRASKSWKEALKSCLRSGADLLCVKNFSEMMFVRNRIRQMNDAFGDARYWIGPNDVKKEGSWKCARRSLTYKRWRTGQPNNANNQDCAVVASNGYWYDNSCSESNRRFICKKMA